MNVPNLPERARVVVVGGGIIGCSVAYHLAHMGWKDVVLLERDRLTSGTTWHAAGPDGHVRLDVRDVDRDAQVLGEALRVARGGDGGGDRVQPGRVHRGGGGRDRLEEYRRVSAFNRYCGVDVHEISAREVGDLFPLARTEDILAGFYVKEDGKTNPVDTTMALAKGARLQGAKIFEGVPVTGFLRRNGAVTGVQTPYGKIEAEYVVNCTGMWARQLGARAGSTSRCSRRSTTI
jgi:glycine/D-amino acid oxidase-like deaminating enzyme